METGTEHMRTVDVAAVRRVREVLQTRHVLYALVTWEQAVKNKTTIAATTASCSIYSLIYIHIGALSSCWRERITGLPTTLRWPSTAMHCLMLAVAWLDLATPKMKSSHRFLAAGKQILLSSLFLLFLLLIQCLLFVASVLPSSKTFSN